MTIGRPKSDDTPEKYRDAYELYQLTAPQLPAGVSASEEIGTFLEWAIREERPGFAEENIISIGALATGVGKARNTVAKGVEKLVAMGMVIRGKAKSPYQIISTVPIFKDSSLVADEKISLTLKMESESHFGEVKSCRLQDPGDDLALFLAQELAGSKDPLIREASGVNWRSGEVQLFQRLRSVSQGDVNQGGRWIGCLAEWTFLRLDPEPAREFRHKVAQLRSQAVRHISLYPILEQCGIRDLRAGRTQISVAPPPKFLGAELRGFVDERQVEMTHYDLYQPLLKWTYALFQPDIAPMVSFSVCFVRADLLGIFIRKMDIELDRPG